MNETPKKLVAPSKDTEALPKLDAKSQGSTLNVPATAEIAAEHEPKQKRKYTRRQPQEPVQATPLSAAEQVNLELLKKSIVAITGAIDNFAVRGIYNKAKRITNDDSISKEIATGVQMTKPELEVVSEATTVIFARHEVLMRHAPEVMLAAVFVTYSGRMLIAMGRLDALEKELKKAHKKGKDEPSAQSE